MADYTQQLAGFLTGLRYQDLPPAVLARMEELFLDWLGSALVDEDQHLIPLFECYTEHMSLVDGSTQILPNQQRSLPCFATPMNGAASHVVEQDDLHNSSVLHPAAAVFLAALAAAQDLGRSGAELILAVVASYEAGVRIGEFLGRSHYRVFHATATVGTLAAAVVVDKLMDFDREHFVDLLGSARVQAAGFWEFLRDAADSKQLRTAKAAADGPLAAYLTADGLSGTRHILEDEQGMAAGTSSDADPERLVDHLGSHRALLETSFKFHASCRHTHPAANAPLMLVQHEGLGHSQIATVTARAHQGAIGVLGRVVRPQIVYRAKFPMGTVLGLIAVYGKADLGKFHRRALSDSRVTAFRRRIEMRLGPGVDAAYPQYWFGRVEVLDNEGRRHTATVNEPRGDPGNTLSRDELTNKLHRLLAFSGTAAGAEAGILIQRTWGLRQAPSIMPLV